MLTNEKKLRIAVIKTDGIGDAVLASPFFFELRKYFKKAHITGILSPAGAEVLSGLRVFDEIKIIDPKWLKYKKTFFLSRWFSALGLLFLVNKGRYDMVIGLRWQDRLTSLILSLCNAKEKYGYDVKGMGFGINHKIPSAARGTHVIKRNLLVLSEILSGRKFSIKLGVSYCRDAACCVSGQGLSGSKPCTEMVQGMQPLYGIKGRYIVIHPVSGCQAKDWPIEKYAELAKRLAKKMPVYIIGAAGDSGIKTVSGKNIHNTAGDLSIKGIATLIKKALLVIGNDSAAVHIASAFNIKSLTLFSGSALYEEWGAYGKNSFILTKNVVCRMCGLKDCDKPAHECVEFEVNYVEKLIKKILAGKQKKRVILY
jgi:ADP-heptose:LPS heptosyltransferase